MPKVCGRYYQRIHCKSSIHMELRYRRHYGLTPGWLGHQTKHVPFRRFEKWIDKPQKAKALYWRIRKSI